MIDYVDGINWQRFKILTLATVQNYKVPAGETHYLPDKTTVAADAKGVDVGGYGRKTISLLFTAAMNYRVEVSNDRTNWIEVYAADGVSSGNPWFEVDCYYVRLKVINPTATDITVTVCHFLARRIT